MRLSYFAIAVLAVLLVAPPIALTEPLILELPPIRIAMPKDRCIDCGMKTRYTPIVTKVSEDPKAIAKLHHAAAAGDLEAQTKLGDLYYYTSIPGKDNAVSRRLGLKWLTRAANRGYAPAQERLIDIYEDIDSPDYEPEKAHAWQVRMAEHGDTGAMIMLGSQYETGSPQPQNYEKAAYWYGKAAESGSVDAMSRLANLYQKETPASPPPFQDIAKAISWYEAAAAKGDTHCMLRLARIYDSERPYRDVAKAVYWYSLLASDTEDFKNTYVMRRLGELYATAPEVKNDGQSFDWYEKAARWYDKDAKVYMCSLPPDIGDDRYIRARQVCNGLDATKVARDEDSAIAMLTSDIPNETAALPILIRAMWQGGQRATDYLGQYALGAHGTPLQSREAARQIGFAAGESWPRPKAWMAKHGDVAQMVSADELDLASLPAGYVVLSPANDGTRHQVPLVEGLRDILGSASDEIDGYDLEEGIDISVSLACQWGDNGWLTTCSLLSETPHRSRFGDTAIGHLVHTMRQVLPLESWKTASTGKWSIIRVHVPNISH